VILVVLALVWAVALTPTVLRKLAERRSSYSVDRFHHSLHAIQFTAPDPRVANKAAVYAVRTNGHSVAGDVEVTPVDPTPAVRRDSSLRVPGPTARRRRHVLGSLLGVVLGAALMGFIPSMRVFWDVAIFALVVGAAYVALLVYFRRMAIERTRKVVLIDSMRPTGVHSLARPTHDKPRAPALVIGG
jgi:hypothetical protein